MEGVMHRPWQYWSVRMAGSKGCCPFHGIEPPFISFEYQVCQRQRRDLSSARSRSSSSPAAFKTETAQGELGARNQFAKDGS